jgi:putative transposase
VPRRPRQEVAGAIHHVVVQASSGQLIVLDDIDRASFLRRLVEIRATYEWEPLAWCLLHTHFHLVVRTAQPNLGRGMQRLTGGYASAFNRRHDRYGHLFAGPYYARTIEDDGHLLRACLYVVLNPVAAGICDHPKNWRWGSYTTTASPVTDGTTQAELLLGILDPDPTRARERYRTVIDKEVRELRAGKRLVPD